MATANCDCEREQCSRCMCDHEQEALISERDRLRAALGDVGKVLECASCQNLHTYASALARNRIDPETL